MAGEGERSHGCCSLDSSDGRVESGHSETMEGEGDEARERDADSARAAAEVTGDRMKEEGRTTAGWTGVEEDWDCCGDDCVWVTEVAGITTDSGCGVISVSSAASAGCSAVVTGDKEEAVAEPRSPIAKRRCAMMDSSMLTCSASCRVEEL